jgi:hypothetical protein
VRDILIILLQVSFSDMIEIILIISVLFLILTFFYKQAICDFRINQMEWTQHDQLIELLGEKVPLVIRSIPSATFWTHDDVKGRPCFTELPIFKDVSLQQWLSTATSSSICPWKYTQAEIIADASGISIWAQKWMNPVIIPTLLKLWMFPRYHCWAGNVGLRKTFATWTCIFPVDGDMMVTIMPESMETSLPASWVDCIPSQLTTKDTPFVNDLKFIDIILRPGHCLFMPAHWFVSWTSAVDAVKPVMTCTISYHTPISYLAFRSSPFIT